MDEQEKQEKKEQEERERAREASKHCMWYSFHSNA